jgi:hypothetical protein
VTAAAAIPGLDDACAFSGKRSYPDEAAASAALDEVRRARSLGGWDDRHGHAPTRVYSCPACGNWHMTSRPDRRKKRRR